MLIQGDARHLPLAAGSVQCVVTSPPYWGLRDYKLEPLVWGGEVECVHTWGDEMPRTHEPTNNIGFNERWGNAPGERQQERGRKGGTSGSFCGSCAAWRGSLGLEPTPELYVQHLVEIFREVRRVLRDDGTVWLVLGDSYCGRNTGNQTTVGQRYGKDKTETGHVFRRDGAFAGSIGLKPKDLIGIPWHVAFALQADGWWLRSDIIWSKPNPMPESVTDRPTRAHEYVFLLTKAARYYYDAAAIAEPADPSNYRANPSLRAVAPGQTRQGKLGSRRGEVQCETRNRRSVWTIATQPYKGAHFATFPVKLVEPCILAGSRSGDVVLDPFVGSGTVVAVASWHRRRGIGVDAKAEYLMMAQERVLAALVRRVKERPQWSTF